MMNEAQALDRFCALGGAIVEMPASDLQRALMNLHCDMSEKENAVAALGSFDANVWEVHPDAGAWYRTQR
jgi:hypothetical protein